MGSDPAVLFDLDGVVVDSRACHLAAWEQLAREEELRPDAGYFTRTFGLRNDAILGGLTDDLPPERLHRLALRKEGLFRSAARGNLAPLPGARELLDLLDTRGVPKAVVTSTPRANLDMVLEQIGFAGRFQTLVAEEDTGKGKPDREGFLLAATRLGVEPPRCVVIEDAPAGIEAAKAAGMRAIGVTTTRPAADLGEADLVVASLADAAVRTFVL